MSYFVLRSTAQAVVDNWEKGDLAAAVRDLAQALKECNEADATPDEIDEARRLYASVTEGIEIDDNATTSRADEGSWVAAWVWLDNPPIEPLAIGSKFRSLKGDSDSYIDEDGTEHEQHTTPECVGTIASINHHDDDGPVYDLVFEPSGVWVCPTHAELTDPEQYEALP